MGFSLFPKNIQFFELLTRQNTLLQKASTELCTIVNQFPDVESHYKAVTLMEAEGDELSREIARLLSQTFITPIDREDIYRLNRTQEDSLNAINAIASRLRLYGFEYIRFPARQMGHYIQTMIALTGEMVACLQSKEDVSSQVRAVRGYKEECEMLFSTGLAELYDQEHFETPAVINIMRWTQMYDRFETAIESVDDLGDAIEEVVLKNA